METPVGVFLDGTWMQVRQDENLEGTFLEFDVRSNVGFVEAGGLYRIAEGRFHPSRDGSATWRVDALAGVRVSILAVGIDFRSGSIFRPPDFDATEVWADPLLGAGARLRFGPDNRLSFSLRGDFGGFGVGSDFTWNLIGGLGYSVPLRSTSVDLFLGGRALYQDYQSGPFLWDVTQYGPVLAAGFRF